MKFGFKPVDAVSADFFSVSIRVPASVMSSLLGRSGHQGLYVEPRSADGKSVL